ncbi:integrin alpha-4-like [Porites lutea]|uniref:integrin alpha-4-like n=1 Tax=Porites lutea TaxID=51062 RepID=UPI003CC554EA
MVLPQPAGLPIGTYYGSAVLAVDLNNDRHTDILVGAPYYTTVKDEGRVFIYLNNGQVCYILRGTDGMKILKPSTPNKQM